MIDPEEKLLAAIREEESDFAEALQEANDILYPDPAKALATAISERKTAVAEWKDCLKLCDALTADLEAIRGMVGRPETTIVEAVRRYYDDDRGIKNDLRQQRDDANRHIGLIAVALGMSEFAPAVAVRNRAKDVCDAVASLTAERDLLQARINDMATSAEGRDRMIGDLTRDRDAVRVARKDATEEVERLSAMLKAAEADAETQRTAADNLRAALDRVAMEAGVDTDSTGAIVADRVIAVLRAMQARPVLTVERLADALRAASVTLEPTMAARAVMAAMSHMGDLVLSESPPTSRPAALPADLRTYLETRRDRLQGGHGLGLAAEIAALNRWLALPTAEVTP